MMKEEELKIMNSRFLAFIGDISMAIFLASCAIFPFYSFSISGNMMLSVLECSAYFHFMHRLLMMLTRHGVRSIWELYFDITPISSHWAQIIGRDLLFCYNLWVISSNPDWILIVPLIFMAMPIRISHLSPLLLDIAFRVHYVHLEKNKFI